MSTTRSSVGWSLNAECVSESSKQRSSFATCARACGAAPPAPSTTTPEQPGAGTLSARCTRSTWLEISFQPWCGERRVPGPRRDSSAMRRPGSDRSAAASPGSTAHELGTHLVSPVSLGNV